MNVSDIDPSGDTDVTDQLNALVKEHTTIEFPEEATYRVNGTWEMKDKLLDIWGNGSTIFTSTDGLQTTRPRERAHVRTIGGRVNFDNLHVSGPWPNGSYVEPLEAQHAFDIRGTLISLNNCSSQNVYGDGLYLGPDVRGTVTLPTTGEVNEFRSVASGRQGISPTCVQNLTINNAAVSHSGRSIFDMEPVADSWFVDGLTVNGGTFGQSPLNFLACKGKGRVENVEFNGCNLTGVINDIGHPLTVEAYADPNGAPRRNFKFHNMKSNASWGTRGQSGAMRFYGVEQISIAGVDIEMQKGRGNAMALLDNCGIENVIIWNAIKYGVPVFLKNGSDGVIAANKVDGVKVNGGTYI